jgi:hypothetical protein
LPNFVLISDYNELVALYKAIHAAKFSPKPMAAELVGSPILASVAIRIAETLDQMEFDQGHPERASWRRPMVRDSSIWKLCIDYVLYRHEVWDTWPLEDKKKYASVIMSPLTVTDEVLAYFVDEIDAIIK